MNVIYYIFTHLIAFFLGIISTIFYLAYTTKKNFRELSKGLYVDDFLGFLGLKNNDFLNSSDSEIRKMQDKLNGVFLNKKKKSEGEL